MSARSNVRRIGAVVLAIVAAGTAVGIGYAALDRPRTGAGTDPVVQTTTAAVTRGTVTEREQVSGTLGYDGSYPVTNHVAAGTVTALADAGATVPRGGILYAVDNQPVRLLYGALPAYRGFVAGMTDGPDVAELEANLVALGFDPDRTMTVDNHFSAATAAAIRRWQAAWGLPVARRTGELEPGRVVFLPGAVRVGQFQAALGGAVGPGAPVLTATSTTRVVTVALTTDRQALVHVGDPVLVTLGGAPAVTGTVLRIGRVATAPAGQGPPGGPTGPATVPVTIGVQLPSGAPDLDQAPVQVAIASAQHTNVLLVPVTALLARPGGGYQVRLADGTYLPVEPGLFDDTTGMVEVTGVRDGQRVEVPAT
jgi:peptidoglycan hydrolase-like protein with peptidoglycan-binding domain